MAASSLTLEDEDFNELFKASKTGDVDRLKNLVAKRGKEGRVIDQESATIALFVAANEGKTHICKYLIEDLNVNPHEIRLDKTVLITSLSSGHIDTSIYLVEKGVDPNRRGPISDLTPLHYAAREGNIMLLELLLSKKADVDAASPIGTPLIEAIAKKKPGAVKKLLDYHADPNSSFHHITPLVVAICARSAQCIEHLADAGAKLNAVICGMTPLQMAIDIQNLEIISCLLGQGADPNFSNEEGLRPLLMAVEIKNIEIIRFLLKAGADPNISNEKGQKPIEVAALRDYREGFYALQSPTTWCPTDPEWSFDEIVRRAYPDEAQRKNGVVQLFEERNFNGTKAFNGGGYYAALFWYTMACNDGLTVQSSSRARAYSNRSLCYLHLNKEAAIRDAVVCWILDSTWPKAYYRLGSALMALKKFSAAAYAFSLGLKLDSENSELKDAYDEAIDKASIHMKKENPKSRDVFNKAIAPYMPN